MNHRNVLAIETSGSYCSVALQSSESQIFSLPPPGSKFLTSSDFSTGSQFSTGSGEHFESLPRMVAEVVAAAGINMREISELRIGTGPGSFTGLRIGMSFAKGLAWSLGLPLRGCSSFAALAALEFLRNPALPRVGVVADARRNELFFGCYQRPPGHGTPGHGTAGHGGLALEPLHEPGISLIKECVAFASEHRIDAWVTPQRDLVVDGLILKSQGEGALGLLALPIAIPSAYNLEELALLEPTYLRAVAAKTIAERALGS